NGKKWYIKEKGKPMRDLTSGIVFSQKDLKRRLDLSRRKTDLEKIEVNTKIVDRSKSIEITKRILDHFNSGFRSALINMATGTGKTRVALAIVESMIRAKHIQNVLFVVDRISLGRNAFYKGFQKHLGSEPAILLNEQEFSKDKRIYVSTVQTLMSKRSKGGFYFEQFGPGFFDLIVFDEAHRSIYDKQNLVMQYFDSLRIGLTATPSKSEAKNTYDLFECERGEPTAQYDYDEAVKDGVLVPYDPFILETKVMKLGIKGLSLDKELRTNLIKQDEDPENFEVPGTRFVKRFTDDKTNALIVSEFMNRCYNSDDGKPAKTIFFCVNVKHAEALRKAFNKIYPNLAEDVEVIVSKYDKYMDAVERFQKESSPRIALSVGVLDTGIDIPEVCNLVFVVPVFSHIRFWQMLGRGTRSLSACEHRKWLPVFDGVHDKKDFRIFDFRFGEFSNVVEHQLETVDKKREYEDIRIKILGKELEVLSKNLTDREKEIVESHVIERIDKIDKESFIVRDKLPMIKKIVSKEFDMAQHVKKIMDEIAPLLKFSSFDDGRIQTFISHCVDLFMQVKEGDVEGFEKSKDFILDRVETVWSSNLESVRRKKDDILRVLQEKFWEELTFDDIDFLIREIAPLMKFYEKGKKRIIDIPAPDEILNIEKAERKIKENPAFERFRNSPLVKKMTKEGVTWKELLQISNELAKLNPSWTIDKIQKTQDFVLFLRNILDLKSLPDPEEMIKREFEKLIHGNLKDYNADQIAFLRLLSSFFAINKHLERQDFTTYPLSEERPLEKFKPEELDKIIKGVEGIRIK
ncbi:MAG: DEAD/DEAH box helicase family protein, partial [Nanoarchaeota archaeon]|nr:DEAD/DEAH box helicase family protein [Nanoarchaeota archaeon]